MESKKIIDKRVVRLEEMSKEGYIPWLGGRPHRETVIGWDDVADLSIALNTINSFEDDDR